MPTGFCTEKAAIGLGIRKKIVNSNWLKAVVQMPPNIFATTGTNVSVLFIDKSKTNYTTILVDASKLGKKVKEGKTQKTLLSEEDENRIIDTINNYEEIEDFSIVVDNKKIIDKKYSFGAGQYFETKIEYCELTPDEFEEKMQLHRNNLEKYFSEGKQVEKEIFKNFTLLTYEGSI